MSDPTKVSIALDGTPEKKFVEADEPPAVKVVELTDKLDSLLRRHGGEPHTCHDMNPPFPSPCKACEEELARLAQDVEGRAKVNPGEHPLITRLVVLRVALNHEFGYEFTPFDRELSKIEADLMKLLTA